ncbi:MAG: hypothetical protein ABI359_07535 [Ginsengibacter sp.]
MPKGYFSDAKGWESAMMQVGITKPPQWAAGWPGGYIILIKVTKYNKDAQKERSRAEIRNRRRSNLPG